MNLSTSTLLSQFKPAKKRYDPHAFQPINMDDENIQDCNFPWTLGFQPCRCCLEIDVSTSPYDTCSDCLAKKRQILAAQGFTFTEINKQIDALLAGPGWKRSKMLHENTGKIIVTTTEAVAEEEDVKLKTKAERSALLKDRFHKWKNSLSVSLSKTKKYEEADRSAVMAAFNPYMQSVESLVVITEF